MSPVGRLPFIVGAPIAAALTGLLLGALASLMPEEGARHASGDDWMPFPQMGTIDVESWRQVLAASPHWRVVQVVTEAPELVREVSGKPGLLAYLRVVAIVREPEPAALLHIDAVPASLAEELLMSTDANGLATVHPGDSVAKGWRVIDISDVEVVLASENERGDSEQNTVIYSLFE